MNRCWQYVRAIGPLAAVLLVQGCGGQNIDVINQAPTATILVPTEGAELYPGRITVQGLVADKEAQEVDLNASFVLTPAQGSAQSCGVIPSSDGTVACDFEVETGDYTLTLGVVDLIGASGDDTVTFSVLLNHAPTAEILEPADGFSSWENEGLSLSGVVDDQDEGPVNLQVSWFVDGTLLTESVPDTSGKVDAFVDAFVLDPGKHLIELVAVDSYDDQGVDPSNVTILECTDGDGDGVTICVIEGAVADCDDTNPARYPGAPEQCDRQDNDCDDAVDEGFDPDGDGYTACGTETGDPDCNNEDPYAFPGAFERCNAVDDNCDGVVDEGWDQDEDGFSSCATVPDCNDEDPMIHPDAVEKCNGLDDNCNELVDDSFDQDGDGVTVCAGDCDDGASAIHPGAEESCDGIDSDCDGLSDVDEGFDRDQDGFAQCPLPGLLPDCDDGDADVYPGGLEVCDQKDNDCDGTRDEELDEDDDTFTPCGGDCNDTVAAVYPGATEVCNEVDDDCDGVIDDGFDKDADGYYVCDHAGFLADCNDYNPDQHPDKVEVCNGLDDDCDGNTDELVKQVFYKDGDGDGYGDPRNLTTECTQPPNYASNNQDCDDDRADTYPGANEKLDGRDNDCDGTVDEGTDCWDDDGDEYTERVPETCPGYPLAYGLHVPKGGDCDDTDFFVNPGMLEAELADGLDNDCDLIADEGTDCWDDDGDGWSEIDVTTCPAYPEAYDEIFPEAGDCDDAERHTYPEALERYDGLDNNCDGLIETAVPLGQASVLYKASLSRAQAGYAVAGPGDINGDHADDLVIGSPGYDLLGQDRGGVYVVFGKASGWQDTYQLDESAVLISEDTAGARAGEAVARAGDLNKDKLADFAVGAPLNSASVSGGGVAYALFGRETGWVNQTFFASGAVTVKGKEGAALGTALAGGGDVSGDGYDDLLIGAPSGTGFVLVLPGKLSGWLPSVTSNDLGKVVGGASTDVGVGTSLAVIGLVDGDLISDVLVGARYDSYSKGTGIWFPGQAALSNPSTVLSVKSLGGASYRGSTNGDMVGGGWVAAGGDVNGDGKSDFFLGRDAWTTTSEPIVFLYLGGLLQASNLASSTATVKILAGERDDCPCSAAGVGDVNGDDIDDFLVGVSGNDEIGGNAGKVYLFYGKNTGYPTSLRTDDADMTFTGEAAGDQAGWSVGPAGDLNADGLADFVIGAPFLDNGSTRDVGRVYVFFGYQQ